MNIPARTGAPTSPARGQSWRQSVRVGRIAGVPVVVRASHALPLLVLGVVFHGVAAASPSPALVTAVTMVGVVISLSPTNSATASSPAAWASRSPSTVSASRART